MDTIRLVEQVLQLLYSNSAVIVNDRGFALIRVVDTNLIRVS